MDWKNARKERMGGMRVKAELNDYAGNVRELNVYRKAFDTAMEIFELSKGFPKEERYALIDQIKRAMNSVLLNLAEGSNKQTDKDTRLYINRAHCSLDEVVSGLDMSLDDGYIKDVQYKMCVEEASVLAKKLNAFETYLFKKINDE